MGYATVGSWIFMTVEGPEEKQVVQDVLDVRLRVVEKIWNLTLEMNSLNEIDWKKNVAREIKLYQEDMIKFIRNGYDGNDNPFSAKQWRFPGAFLYSLTVITTIGIFLFIFIFSK